MFAVTHMLYALPLHAATGSSIGLLMAVLSGLCLCLPLPKPLTGASTYLVGVYVALIGFMGLASNGGAKAGRSSLLTELSGGQ